MRAVRGWILLSIAFVIAGCAAETQPITLPTP